MTKENIFTIGIFSFTITDSKVNVFITKEVESELALPLFARQVADNIERIVNSYKNLDEKSICTHIEHVYNVEVRNFGAALIHKKKVKHET
jgi:hypothetical protein